MILFKNKYKTDSNRLKNWDYSGDAIYFITIVTQNRESIFGTVENEAMKLNDNGEIIETELKKSISIRKNWFFHNWVVMPNHIHLLIEIQNNPISNAETHNVETHSVETHSSASLRERNLEDDLEHHLKDDSKHNHDQKSDPQQDHDNPKKIKLTRKPNSISSFVAIFKSVTTKQIGNETSIWQSNYHDSIVRNHIAFDKIYNYIKNNPRNWETDPINSNFQ
ncbi:transposase [Flavobacterium sp. Fl-318]|uniref:Transposase n=1 Tax=Flavobacterium cupriresistens TaxID=2893885 RepID=A0ABU4R9J3_9FLAO|nr:MULTISPECIES: transposase [unclassified Flavobacterium]MDX6189242.1 transposase [Flavobacterium sp. Fl-318]UFH41338.1 hypothetical protein LNP23_16155 [Flavobacterium sp. F-323]